MFAYSNLISLAPRPCKRRLLSPVDASLLLSFKPFVITSCGDVQLSEAALKANIISHNNDFDAKSLQAKRCNRVQMLRKLVLGRA
jgi:hypothetical protein